MHFGVNARAYLDAFAFLVYPNGSFRSGRASSAVSRRLSRHTASFFICLLYVLKRLSWRVRWMSTYAGHSPKQLYRSFFRCLRHLPDPHVWSILQPRFRTLLHRSTCITEIHAESSAQGALRAKIFRENVEDELRRLHMAVSYYPHALKRLLDLCYGRKGHIRWQLIRVGHASFAEHLHL